MDLVSVAPGALANHCGAIIPGTLVSLTLVCFFTAFQSPQLYSYILVTRPFPQT